MEFIFLNENFYSKYNTDEYKQLEQKENRPYIHIIINIGNKNFAIPLRSHIDHPHAYFTDKQNKCGADYSKAVPIMDDDINKNLTPHIRPNEFKKLKGKDNVIKNGFLKYIQVYKDALNDESYNHRKDILEKSTLQYFHNEFNIETK